MVTGEYKLEDTLIDFRSDTVTCPTDEMRRAIYEAEVGDDVLGEDPSVNRLEKLSAEILEKEAALLVPSGTFGNQLALFTHCNRSDEVILSEESHIIQHEVGAGAVIAGINLRPVPPAGSYITAEQIEPRIRKGYNIHFPDSGLIELENALSNGDVQPLESMGEVRSLSNRYGIPIHLDGARIFNASLALGVDAAEIASLADSVMFCLSKGLAAPVGSLLAGTGEFIREARKKRKVMGGGMRQAGIIAAAGVVALKRMRERLKEDHDHALRLACSFAEQGDVFGLDLDTVKINMVFVSIKGRENSSIALEQILRRYGVLTYPREGGLYRFVTHHGITSDDIESVCAAIPKIADEIRTSMTDSRR